MSAIKNVTFYKGETWIFDIDCNDASLVPMNLVGGQVEMRISDAANPLTILLDITTANGTIAWVAQANGQALASIDASQQTWADFTTYRYAVQSTTSSGIIGIQAVGNINVKESQFS